VLRYSDELTAAEKEARDAKRGMWLSYVEKVEEVRDDAAGDELVNVRVCEVVDGSSFFAHAAVDDMKVR
jgi:hypothetical protein